MSLAPGDPIGSAIHDYAASKKPADIIVSSDICEDDIIPIEVLFRSLKDMPEIEKKQSNCVRGMFSMLEPEREFIAMK